MKKLNRLFSILLAFSFIIIQPVSVYAAPTDNLDTGTYNLSATLSCYVNAMGGVEFGKSLLKSSMLIVDKNGKKKIKLNLTKSAVTIYNITCDTFIDASPSGTAQESNSQSANGTIGYYDKNGKLQTSGVTHTLSKDTALNSKNEAVKYVDSITFPVDTVSNTYKLTLFVNSNVMGMQFDPATLTVDWSSIQSSGGGNSESGKKSDSDTTAANQNAKNSSKSGNGESAAANASESASAGDMQNNANSQNTSEQESDQVIKKDGLDIHYANGNSKLNSGDSDYGDIPFYVYLNMPVLIGMAIFSGVLIILGITLLIVSKKQKEKKQDEQNH
ncbi:MAG: hypothetical protein LIO43_00420 [Clostridiales bacterium]|nr:hypothetical protein [Clostridiales bacterium]